MRETTKIKNLQSRILYRAIVTTLMTSKLSSCVCYAGAIHRIALVVEFCTRMVAAVS